MSEQPVIMCAVDSSWRSQAAFTYAVALVKSRGARLNLLFAVPARRRFNWRMRERVALLAEPRRQASAADVDMTVSVQHGDPADVILAHANSRSTAPDLIVLGAPSRRGIERLRWPSVAHAVVHQADRPTLVVPGSPSTNSDVAVPFRRVLCAIDCSPASMSALDEALRILRNDGGTMRLLHVVDIAQPDGSRQARPAAGAHHDKVRRFVLGLIQHSGNRVASGHHGHDCLVTAARVGDERVQIFIHVARWGCVRLDLRARSAQQHVLNVQHRECRSVPARSGQRVPERSLRRFREIYGTKNSAQCDHFKAQFCGSRPINVVRRSESRE